MFEQWDRLAWALARPRTADDQLVDALEERTVALLRNAADLTAPSLAGAASCHLDDLTTLLHSGPAPAVRDRLCSLAGETAALAGWLRWNLGELGSARQFYRVGLEAARCAQDAALAAYLVGCMASQPLHRENPTRRLQLLHGGACTHATPHTAAWLAVLEAGAYAMRRDFASFEVAVARARELLARPEDEDVRRPRVQPFDAAYLGEEIAAGYLRLGMPGMARREAEQALEGATGRIRLWLQVDLADAAAAEGEPELAAGHAMAVAPTAVAFRLEPILEALRELSCTLPGQAGAQVAAALEA